MGKWGTAFDIARDVVEGLRAYLSLHERDVLWFIYARTRLFNKEWETIPIRHFMHGILSAEGALVTAPVSMGEPKLLESLGHLEGKHVIQVRRHPVNASQYRVCEDEEIDQPHVLQYITEHQPRLLQSHFGRIVEQDTLQNRVRRMVRSPRSLGTATNNGGERVTNGYGEHNIPIENKPILNPTAAPSGLRVLPLPVKPASTSPRRITITKK